MPIDFVDCMTPRDSDCPGPLHRRSVSASVSCAFLGALTLALAGALVAEPGLRPVAAADVQQGHAVKPGGSAQQDRRRIWERPGGGMTFALAVDPSRPGTVYAGTAHGGIFASTNRGRSWRRLMFSWRAGRVMCLAVDGAGRVYAAFADGRIKESTDAGGSWKVAYKSAGRVEVRSLALDHRTKPMTVYAGTSAGEVVRSTDAGKTWSASGDGLEGQSVNAVAVDPRRRAGVVWAGAVGGIFRSSDAGAHWRRVSPLGVRELALDPTRPRTLFGASGDVLRSTDAGRTWKNMSGIKYALSLVVDSRKRPGPVYLGTSYTSVLKSTDGGDTWAPASGGLSPLGEVVELAVDTRTSPSTLYAATSHVGVHWSTDGGTSWHADEGGVADATDGAARPAAAE
jgi:photosystem II stability/assembly factor-like uncharacterized protein